MNHNAIAAKLGYLANTRSYTAFHSQEERERICQGCDGDFCRERVHDAHKCIYRALLVGATAIYDLTAQLEAERRENEELRKKITRLNEARENANEACAKWEWRAKRAEARAEKAENKFDTAMDRMKNVISGDVYPCEVCKHLWKCARFKPQRRCDYFEYGIKEG